MTKICTKCKVEKSIEEFSKDAYRQDGLKCSCKRCANEYTINWKTKNPEKATEATRKTYLKYQEERQRAGRDYYHKNVKLYPEKYKGRSKARYAANPERHADLKRRSKYNLEPDAFYGMIARQNNSCAICGKVFGTGKQGPFIDHNHKCCEAGKSCGKCIRGLLCSACNMALGYVMDNPDILRKAADYLESYPKEEESCLDKTIFVKDN